MKPSTPQESAETLRRRLQELLDAVEAGEAEQGAALEAVLPRHRQSAANLLHYLTLRRLDLHGLQLELSAAGLSSLGSCEGHVRDTLRRLLAWLDANPARAIAPSDAVALDTQRAEAILHENTRALFGPRPKHRHVYVMVTAPDAAEVSPEWIDELLGAGANSLRINAAHEGPEQWRASARLFKERAQALGVPARVFVDLPGPKLRAEITAQAEGVVHLPRHKNRFGRTLSPTRVRLVESYREGAELPVPRSWLTGLHSGDRIELTDSGGRTRELTVERGTHGDLTGRCDRSLFLASSLAIAWWRGNELVEAARSGPLPPARLELSLRPGDELLVHAPDGVAGTGLPALVLSEPQILARVRVGERVIFDDGKLVGRVESTDGKVLRCRVQSALKTPTRLRSGKGIAFPDSRLESSVLGARDQLALSVALEVADGVGVSFVNSEADVAAVRERIERGGRADFGLLLKLETQAALRNLPAILLEALKYHPVGLMIARGDLAVELSFERLAELQEEILWFGEACHLPVVWATQVLETVAHSALATRAEVTDAAMSTRAECVMLNKGPHIAAAVRMLTDIICKMEAHQYKKRPLYRKLSIAGRG